MKNKATHCKRDENFTDFGLQGRLGGIGNSSARLRGSWPYCCKCIYLFIVVIYFIFFVQNTGIVGWCKSYEKKVIFTHLKFMLSNLSEKEIWRLK
jgi:hypothetical protein